MINALKTLFINFFKLHYYKIKKTKMGYNIDEIRFDIREEI